MLLKDLVFRLKWMKRGVGSGFGRRGLDVIE